MSMFNKQKAFTSIYDSSHIEEFKKALNLIQTTQHNTVKSNITSPYSKHECMTLLWVKIQKILEEDNNPETLSKETIDLIIGALKCIEIMARL